MNSIGDGRTVFFQMRKSAHIRRLKSLISTADTKQQLGEAKALLRKSVANERLTQAQYTILLEEADARSKEIETLISGGVEVKKLAEVAHKRTGKSWNKAMAEALGDQAYKVDEDGVEWWEDEKGTWWYRHPGDSEWGEWED